MPFTYEQKMQFTKALATVGTGTFAAGTAMHLTNVVPTFMKELDMESALKMQRGMTVRIAPLVGSLAVGMGAAGAVYYMSKNRKEDLPWLVGGATLAALFPYTFYFLSPINNRVLAQNISASEAPAVLKKWHMFASVRGATTFAIFAWFAYLSTKGSKEV